jgi:hypothetical protein
MEEDIKKIQKEVNDFFEKNEKASGLETCVNVNGDWFIIKVFKEDINDDW